MAELFWFTILLLVNMGQPHGYVKRPASRAYLCYRDVNRQCGNVRYEPQSIEAPKGFPNQGPRDRHIAGGGKFAGLDATGRHRWVRNNLAHLLLPLNKTHSLLPMQWVYTAPHRTSGYHLFATKAGYDGSRPLRRRHLRLIDYLNSDGAPYSRYNYTIANKKLYAVGVLLSIWNIADTSNAFYQVIDYKYCRYCNH